MCILAVATAGAKFSRDTLEDMFYANSDGAGWAYAKDGKIYFAKGYTNINKFIKAVQKLPADVERMVHCRIATHGGVCRELTHPFPVSPYYAKMETLNGVLSSGYILAHNGILTDFKPPANHSDTEELVRCLANVRGDIMDEGFREIINRLVDGSRVAILNTDGKINRYGTGWTEDGGIWFSNTYFKARRKYYKSYAWDDWDDWDYSAYKTANNLPDIKELRLLDAGEVVKNTVSKTAYITATEGTYLLDDKTDKLYGQYNGELWKTGFERCSTYNCEVCTYKCPFKEMGA